MSDPDPEPPPSGCVPWDIDPSCCDCDNWDNLTPAIRERSEQLAWDTIKVLTGGQVGNCPVTMRPCLGPPCTVCNPYGNWNYYGTWMVPYLQNGNWYNSVCGVDPCSCERMCEIVTPGAIAELTSIRLDGVEMPLTDFRVDNGNRIVRMDGECWPSCQNMNLPLGEPGTLGITYIPGVKPGPAGLWAAAVLACEFSKACMGNKCRLPSSVSQIVRQGVTMTLGAGLSARTFRPEAFPGGLTGIREVDAYIYSVNPNALRMPAMVWSPDLTATKHRYQTLP